MKILTIFTGGTIACSSDGGILAPDPEKGFLLLDMYKRIDSEVEFDTVQPYYILSENLSPRNLNTLYECISSAGLDGYDGVIVAHGTDTVQYTGAFLSLRLGLCDTPVALVSANYPLTDTRSNGFENFRAAVTFIKSSGAKGVFIAYRNGGESRTNIHRAIRVLPHMPYSDSLFSLYGSPYGYVENGKYKYNPDYSEDKSEFEVYTAPLDKKVMYLKVYVGMTYPALSEEFKAVLLEGYHSGTLNTESKRLSDFCTGAKALGIPVFLTGCAEGFNYASKKAFSELGIRVLPPESPITAYMRLLLG